MGLPIEWSASFVPTMPQPPSTPNSPRVASGATRLWFGPAGRVAVLIGLIAASLAPAWAEKADRNQRMVLESDKPCVVNMAKQTSQCSGNVVITQGTLLIRADRVELREAADGYRLATALGAADKAAHYRQKRDGVDEFVEGDGARIDYDERAGTLRFDGKAVVKRLRGGVVADEIHGDVLIWDSNAEQFNAQGTAATATTPGSRVRMVLAPRAPASGASGAATGAAALASAPAAALRPATSLGDRR